MKTDPIAARIEGLTLEGEIENDSDGTQTGALPFVDLGLDLDPTTTTKRTRDRVKRFKHE